MRLSSLLHILDAHAVTSANMLVTCAEAYCTALHTPYRHFASHRLLSTSHMIRRSGGATVPRRHSIHLVALILRAVVLSGGNVKMSGGFYGILLALHLCGKVQLYGFGQSNDHYYVKGRKGAGATPFAVLHLGEALPDAGDGQRRGRLVPSR